MQYDDSYTGEARITLTSLFLLVVFVSAFALIVAAIVWRPWFDDSDSTVVQQPNPEATADAVTGGEPVTNEEAVPGAEQVGVPAGQ